MNIKSTDGVRTSKRNKILTMLKLVVTDKPIPIKELRNKYENLNYIYPIQEIERLSINTISQVQEKSSEVHAKNRPWPHYT